MNKSTTGAISLILSAAIYGSFGLLIQWMGAEMSVMNQIVFRYTLALGVILVLFAVIRPRIVVPRNSWPVLILLAGLMQGSIWSFTQGAILTSISSLLGSFYIGSIATSSILGSLVFKDRVEIKSWIGTLLAVVGLYVLVHENTNVAGVIFGLIAGMSESMTQAIRKYLHGVSPGAILLTSVLGILVLSLMTNYVAGNQFRVPVITETWVAGGCFALLLVMVNLLITYGFRRVSMNVGSIIMSSELLFGMVMSAMLLSTNPTTSEAVAATAIMASIITQNVAFKSNNRLILLMKRVLEN